MKFLFLPTPLTEPEKWDWPREGREGAIVLPLEIATETGGPLTKFFEKAIATGEVQWWLPANPSQGDVSFSIFIEQARKWISKSGAKTLFVTGDSNDRSSWTPHFNDVISVETAKDFTAPTVTELSEICFPRTRSRVSELVWRRLVEDYKSQMQAPALVSIESLRFFAGFLRRAQPQEAESAAVEWAKVQALTFSDDTESATSPNLRLNPTATFVRLNSSGTLRGIARVQGEIVELNLDWQQAALVDELAENPSLGREALLGEIAAKHVNGLKRDHSDEEALDALVRSGFVIV